MHRRVDLMHYPDIEMENRILFQCASTGALGGLTLAGTLGADRGVSANPMRVLGSYALVYVESGGGGYRDANGAREPVRAGDTILLFPELPHAYGPRLFDGRAALRWDERYVLFGGPLFDVLRTAGVLCPLRPVFPAPPGWGGRLREIVGSHRPPSSAEEALEFARLLAELTPAGGAHEASWVERASVELSYDLQAPLDLSRVADAFGLSAESFRKRFAREAGTTPARFRAVRRLEAAESLLRNTAMPLRSIAEALGFVDEFHLSHAYKRGRGVPPSTVRRSPPP